MLLQQAYELFIADRKISGCTPKTLAFYHDSAGAFLRFASDSEPDLPVGGVVDFVTPFSFLYKSVTFQTRPVIHTGVGCVPSCAFSIQRATCLMKSGCQRSDTR